MYYGKENISYVASIWPSLKTILDIPYEGFEKGLKYPVLYLAERKIIDIEGWENIILIKDELENGFKGIGIKKKQNN